MNEYPLERTFESVRPSIVAFASRLVRRERPEFPDIVGTGFVVDPRGVVATNRHVIDALKAIPRHPRTNEPSAFCILPTSIQRSGDQRYMGTLFVGIRGYNVLESFVPAGPYYGQSVPDFGFIQIEVQELATLPLRRRSILSSCGHACCDGGVPSRDRCYFVL
jgi:hypothetical protein